MCPKVPDNLRVPKHADFEATFKTLRALLKPYQRHFVVIVDKPGKYYLSTKTSKTRSGAAIWFGGVAIKKNYVSFHLIPVYAAPALLKEMPRLTAEHASFDKLRMSAHGEPVEPCRLRGLGG